MEKEESEIRTAPNGQRYKRMGVCYDYRSEFGTAHGYVDCPWCGETGIKVYIWSLAGSGKLCPKCKAHLTTGCAYEYQPKARKARP